MLRRRYELLSPPPIAVVVASGANLRGSPGHGHALGMLVVYVLTEGQVKAAVKETKKKVEKKTEKAADKTEKVLLSSPLSPLYPPFRGSWSMYRGYGYMATGDGALPRHHGCATKRTFGLFQCHRHTPPSRVP